MSKSFRLWSREDVERLRVLYAEKRPLSEIALALQRTPGACENKLFESGIAKRQPVYVPPRLIGGQVRAPSPVDAPRRWWEALLKENLRRLAAAGANEGPWQRMSDDDRVGEIAMLIGCCAAVRDRLGGGVIVA